MDRSSADALAAARIRMALAARTTDVPGEQLDLLDRWIEMFDVWQSGARVDVDLAAWATIELDELTWELSAPVDTVLADVAASLDHLGASELGAARLRRLGEVVAPARLGAWLQVGASGVDAGWSLAESVTLDELRQADVPAEVIAWMEREGLDELRTLEGGFGSEPFLGGAVLVSATGIGAEDAQRVYAGVGAPAVPADLLVAVEELHTGPVWLSVWFVDGVGPVKVGLTVAEPTSELLVACAMARDVDEDDLARFGAAVGAVVPASVELESWPDGARVRLRYDVIGLPDDPDEVTDDDPGDPPAQARRDDHGQLK